MNKMIKVGNIFSLYYTPSQKHISSKVLHLDTRGIIEDKHYDKDISRSVLIVSLDSYTLAKKHHIDAPFGALGENILMDYNPYSLPVGSKLKIGSVILEISQHCTLCKSFTKVDTKLPKLLKNDRGIFAKVIDSGKISKGDKVYLLD